MNKLTQDVIEAKILSDELKKLKDEMDDIAKESLEYMLATMPKVALNKVTEEEIREYSKRLRDYHNHLEALRGDLETGLKIMEERYGHILKIGKILEEAH